MSVASPGEHAVDARWPRRWQHARGIARLAMLYVTFDALKHVVPLPALVRWAWLRPTGPRDRTAEDRVLRCMVRLRRWLPADRGDCLHGSLALYRALSATGSSPTLVVGFRKDAPAIAGHAWVEVDGVAQLEVPPETAGFVAAFEFGENGEKKTR